MSPADAGLHVAQPAGIQVFSPRARLTQRGPNATGHARREEGTSVRTGRRQAVKLRGVIVVDGLMSDDLGLPANGYCCARFQEGLSISIQSGMYVHGRISNSTYRKSQIFTFNVRIWLNSVWLTVTVATLVQHPIRKGGASCAHSLRGGMASSTQSRRGERPAPRLSGGQGALRTLPGWGRGREAPHPEEWGVLHPMHEDGASRSPSRIRRLTRARRLEKSHLSSNCKGMARRDWMPADAAHPSKQNDHTCSFECSKAAYGPGSAANKTCTWLIST